MQIFKRPMFPCLYLISAHMRYWRGTRGAALGLNYISLATLTHVDGSNNSDVERFTNKQTGCARRKHSTPSTVLHTFRDPLIITCCSSIVAISSYKYMPSCKVIDYTARELTQDVTGPKRCV